MKLSNFKNRKVMGLVLAVMVVLAFIITNHKVNYEREIFLKQCEIGEDQLNSDVLKVSEYANLPRLYEIAAEHGLAPVDVNIYIRVIYEDSKSDFAASEASFTYLCKLMNFFRDSTVPARVFLVSKMHNMDMNLVYGCVDDIKNKYGFNNTASSTIYDSLGNMEFTGARNIYAYLAIIKTLHDANNIWTYEQLSDAVNSIARAHADTAAEKDRTCDSTDIDKTLDLMVKLNIWGYFYDPQSEWNAIDDPTLKEIVKTLLNNITPYKNNMNMLCATQSLTRINDMYANQFNDLEFKLNFNNRIANISELATLYVPTSLEKRTGRTFYEHWRKMNINTIPPSSRDINTNAIGLLANMRSGFNALYIWGVQFRLLSLDREAPLTLYGKYVEKADQDNEYKLMRLGDKADAKGSSTEL